MATLADELQNDFADSGDELEQYDEDEEATAPIPSAAVLNGADGEIDMAGDHDDEEEDEEMGDGEGFHDEADEETQARLQRQRQLAVPKDMAAVSKFVTSMKPVLEVSRASSISRSDIEFTTLSVQLP